jgi:signal transduction histidine kinase
LTQEAQGAAERLRKGVSALTQPPPSGVELKELAASTRDAEVPTGPDGGDPAARALDADASHSMDASLSVLDDAMRILSSLHARPASRGRRGRIDLASLLWEVAPEARVSIEPGSGTEVFGDESEIRRMLHVFLGHGPNAGGVVSVRREGDEVVVAVVMGPDSSPTADTERAWLSRMAVRYGGRYEIEGGTEVLALPAEGVEARDDVAKLRKELDEAKKQGEAYARELAAVWAASDEAVSSSSYPPPQTPAVHRLAAMTRFSGGVAATLRAILSPVGRDLAELRVAASSGPASRRSSPEIDVHALPAKSDLDEKLEAIRRKFLVVQDFVAELAMVGESEPEEPMRAVDLVDVVRGQVRALEARAARAGVDVRVQTVPADAGTRAVARVGPRAVAVLVRELLTHATAASTRGSAVTVTLQAPTEAPELLGPRLIVDDTGTSLPGSARRPLVSLEVEPGTFGRPSGVGLFIAAEIALAEGALLEVGDAPAGGVRVTVTFPR